MVAAAHVEPTASSLASSSTAFRSWPVRFKILVPFAVLALAYTAVGTYLVANSTATETRAAVATRLRDQSTVVGNALIAEHLVAARIAGVAAATDGLDRAVDEGDRGAIAELIAPLAATQPGSRIAVVDADGTTLFDVFFPVGADAMAAPQDPLLTAESVWGSTALFAAQRDGNDRVNVGLVATTLEASPEPIAYSGAAQRIGFDGGWHGSVFVGRPLGALLADLAQASPALAVTIDDGRIRVGAPLDADTQTDAFIESAQARAVGEHRHGGEQRTVLFSEAYIGDQALAGIAVGLESPRGLALLGASGIRLLALATLSLIAVSLVGLWIARRITSPLERLVAAADRLAAGALYHRASVEVDDEIGSLAVAFNRMADSLEVSHRTLEDRVEQRTTELSDALHRLEATHERLEGANRAKSDFIAAMSHDLRAPLGSMLLGAEMLQLHADELSTADVASIGDAVTRSGRHLLSLIDNLLDMGKIEARRLSLDVVDIEAGELVADAVAALSALADERGIELELPETSGLSVAADPTRARQVLINLLSNALKFTSPPGRVWVTVAARGREVAITIHDEGPGISAEDLERIFVPFEQTAATRHQGTGLGLAISRELAELHGGRLTATSKPGHGSSFTFTLPQAGRSRPRPRPGRVISV